MCDRFAGQVTLHLGLIAPEISQRQEHPADQAAPEVVLIVRVEMRVYHIQLSGRPGQAYRVDEGDALRQEMHRNSERQHQRAED